MPDNRIPIAHDAPLTEVWITKRGVRSRVYRGDTVEHIAWKMEHHEKEGNRPELIVVETSDVEEFDPNEVEWDNDDPRDDGLAGV